MLLEEPLDQRKLQEMRDEEGRTHDEKGRRSSASSGRKAQAKLVMLTFSRRSHPRPFLGRKNNQEQGRKSMSSEEVREVP